MSIAIIGSGPAGLYTADALSRALPGTRIDIIERLPFPFGLIRYGVAPDHETTKNVTQVLSRVFSRPGVRFHGDIEVGRDISLSEIQSYFDVVVIATGAQLGRKLDIPGLSPSRCMTAYDMARWFNGHPDFDVLDIPTNVRSVCILGNGNVALDMARIFGKPPDELAKYDVSDPALAWLSAIDLTEIHIVGRRRSDQTRFSPAELSELGRLSRFQPRVSSADIAPTATTPENGAALAVLREFSSDAFATARMPVSFHFSREPVRYHEGWLELSGSDRSASIPADLVIFAIGQTPSSLSGLGGAADGTSDQNSLFRAGWAEGSDQGDISKARAAGADLASKIVPLVQAKLGGSLVDFLDLCREKRLNPVSWEEWQRIDKHEIAQGAAQFRRRRKLVAKRKSDLLNNLVQVP